MPSYNKVILMGNLTRDPELAYTPNGTAVCKFGIAVNEKWIKDGEKKESVLFVDGTIFGKQAETFNQFMKSGRPVLVEGKLRFEQWTSKEGQKRSRHSVAVNQFTFLGDGNKDGIDPTAKVMHPDTKAAMEAEQADASAVPPPPY